MAISDQTTVLSNVSLTGNLRAATIGGGPVSDVSSSRGTFANVWATSEVSSPSIRNQGGAILSGVTADFRTNAVIQSWATRADESGITIGQLGLLFQASGVSLILSSGKSYYIIGQSAVSGAHA